MDAPVRAQAQPQMHQEMQRSKRAIHAAATALRAETSSSKLNELAPIERLPPEVLAEVFLHCTADDPWIRAYEATKPTNTTFCLSRVSRRWRAVALGTPRLWSPLRLEGPAGYLDALLARSGDALLCVATGCLHRWTETAASIAPVMRHVPRIRCLTAGDSAHSSALRELVSRELSALRELTVYASSVEDGDLAGSCQRLRAPVLEHLTIIGGDMSWTNRIFQHNLVKLHFERSLTETSDTFTDVLDALETMPQLQSLTLRNVLPDIDPQTQPSPRRSIHLPFLLDLNVEASPSACAYLLQSLVRPPSTVCDIVTGGPEPNNPAFLSIIADTISGTPAVQIGSPVPPHLQISVAVNSYVLCIAGYRTIHPFVDGKSAAAPDSQASYHFHGATDRAAVATVLQALPLRSTRSLILRDERRRPEVSIDTETWAACLRPAIDLRELYVDRWGIATLPAALRQTVPLPSLNCDSCSGTNGAQSLLLPHVEKLTLQHAQAADDRDVLVAYRHALAERKARGLPLRRLELAEGAGATQADIDAFSKCVAAVVCDSVVPLGDDEEADEYERGSEDENDTPVVVEAYI